MFLRRSVSEKLQDFLFGVLSALQAGKIYSMEHPRFKEMADRAYDCLLENLKEKKEIVIGIIEEELTSEGEIYFDLGQKLKPLVHYLKERGLERIIFSRYPEREEFFRFLFLLNILPKDFVLAPEEYLAREGIKNIRAGKLKAPYSESDQEREKKLANVLEEYRQSLLKVSESIEMLLGEREIDSYNLHFSVLSFMNSFMGKYPELLNRLSTRNREIMIFMHLLNVSLLSMFFSSKLGFSREEVLDIGIAALFHDVGRMSLSKKKPVSGNHSLWGSKILLPYSHQLGVLPVVVAFEHHWGYRMRGLARNSLQRLPHLVSRIVAIGDAYDLLTQRRNFREAYSTLEIYQMMAKRKGKAFDPFLLEKFFQFLGVWPVGTIVVLTSGDVAIVREANESDIFHPKVEILFPPEKREVVNLSEKRGELQISDSLNPYGEGKKYLNYLYQNSEI